MKRISRHSAQETYVPQDWTNLEPSTKVEIIHYDGYRYRATVDAMTPDTKIVWVHRLDDGSRHLLEYRDGARIIPLD